jgi:quercetin dioxygenase-like cupin family protein
MPDRFEDERGVIQDLLGPIDAVTHIFTRKDAVRGNHIHHATTQWTWVLSGRLLIVTEANGFRLRHEYGPGEMAEELPGIPHAWRALEDTSVLVFTRGPRSGEAYESDTQRLKVPLL